MFGRPKAVHIHSFLPNKAKISNFNKFFWALQWWKGKDIYSVTATFTISETTVGPCCPLPYVDTDGKYCFFLTLSKQNFDASINLCQQKNGFLARIDTAEKNATLINYVEGQF